MRAATALVPRVDELMPEPKPNFDERGAQLVAVAKALTIKSHDDYRSAVARRSEIKRYEQDVKAYYREPKELAHRVHGAICTMEKEDLARVTEGDRILAKGILDWDNEQDRQRRELERKLREEQRRQDDERRLAEAEAFEAQGETALAERVLEEPSFVAPVVVERLTPKVEGQSFREVWTCEVYDREALIRAIAEDLARPPESRRGLIEALPKGVSTAWLNQQARNQKGSLRIPGCRPVMEKQSITAAAK